MQTQLVLEGDGSARYFGVIQVIDFCNGKVIGDQLPPENSVAPCLGRRKHYTQLTSLIHSNGPFPCCPHLISKPLEGGDLVYSCLPLPSHLVRCLSQSPLALTGDAAYHRLAGRGRRCSLCNLKAPGQCAAKRQVQIGRAYE